MEFGHDAFDEQGSVPEHDWVVGGGEVVYENDRFSGSSEGIEHLLTESGLLAREGSKKAGRWVALK